MLLNREKKNGKIFCQRPFFRLQPSILIYPSVLKMFYKKSPIKRLIDGLRDIQYRKEKEKREIYREKHPPTHTHTQKDREKNRDENNKTTWGGTDYEWAISFINSGCFFVPLIPNSRRLIIIALWKKPPGSLNEWLDCKFN